MAKVSVTAFSGVMQKTKVDCLKDILRGIGQSVYGTKGELILRIGRALQYGECDVSLLRTVEGYLVKHGGTHGKDGRALSMEFRNLFDGENPGNSTGNAVPEKERRPHPPQQKALSTAPVSCLCKNKGVLPGMVECTHCHTSQHEACMGVGVGGSSYLCASCRFLVADPFCRSTSELVPLSTLKQIPGMPPCRDGKGNYHARLQLNATFYLSLAELASCNAPSSRLRVFASCLLLEDTIQERMHWPKNVQMRVNNMSIKPYLRGLGSDMGINQRDAVVDITRMLCQGRNSLSLMAVENGTWVVRVCVAERLGMEEVKGLMMREETLEEARERMAGLLRVTVGDDADADADGANNDHVVGLETMSFSLKDPLTCLRMEVPARFEGASGTQAFDLDSFLSMAETNRKWQDPMTMKNSTLQALRVDSYVRAVGEVMGGLEGGEAVTNFEVNAAGDWRPEGYVDGWFDVRKGIADGGEELTRWVQAQGGGSDDEDETLDYQEVREEGIDVRNEMLEATSALLSVGGAAVNANGGASAGGVSAVAAIAAPMTALPAATTMTSTAPSSIQGRTSKQSTGRKRARPAVDVIDLCDSD